MLVRAPNVTGKNLTNCSRQAEKWTSVSPCRAVGAFQQLVVDPHQQLPLTPVFVQEPTRRASHWDGVPDSEGIGRGSDSGGLGRISSIPAGEFFVVFHSLYGHFDSTEIDSGFGRIRYRVGFGRIRTHSWTPNMEITNPGVTRKRQRR